MIAPKLLDTTHDHPGLRRRTGAVKVSFAQETELGLFSSDNGPWWQGNPGSVRGHKNLPFEGDYRVPMIARRPGVLPASEVRDALCSSMDLFGTCLACAGVPLPDDRIVDGRDILPVLQGQAASPHEALYYYKGRRALGVRQGPWKGLRRHRTDNGGYASLSQGPFLFNLETDPNESYSMIESRPEIARQMARMLDEWDAEIEHNPRGWISPPGPCLYPEYTVSSGTSVGLSNSIL
jgi:uncharacterized sulfatase